MGGRGAWADRRRNEVRHSIATNVRKAEKVQNTATQNTGGGGGTSEFSSHNGKNLEDFSSLMSTETSQMRFGTEFYKEVGFLNGTAKVVSPAELRAALNNGDARLLRGISADTVSSIKKFQDNSLTDASPRMSGHVYGYGIAYVAVTGSGGSGKQESLSTANAYNSGGRYRGVMRGALDKGARVADYSTITNQASQFRTAYQKNLSNQLSSGKITQTDYNSRNRAVVKLTSDPSMFAAYKGFDAMRTESSKSGSSYMTILNRTKTTWQRLRVYDSNISRGSGKGRRVK
jgi:hypothetical protein